MLSVALFCTVVYVQVLTDDNLNSLDEIYKVISPPAAGEENFGESLNTAAEHINSLVEGRERAVANSTYKELMDLLQLIIGCGYFERARQAEEKEGAAGETWREDFGDGDPGAGKGGQSGWGCDRDVGGGQCYDVGHDPSFGQAGGAGNFKYDMWKTDDYDGGPVAAAEDRGESLSQQIRDGQEEEEGSQDEVIPSNDSAQDSCEVVNNMAGDEGVNYNSVPHGGMDGSQKKEVVDILKHSMDMKTWKEVNEMGVKKNWCDLVEEAEKEDDWHGDENQRAGDAANTEFEGEENWQETVDDESGWGLERENWQDVHQKFDHVQEGGYEEEEIGDGDTDQTYGRAQEGGGEEEDWREDLEQKAGCVAGGGCDPEWRATPQSDQNFRPQTSYCEEEEDDWDTVTWDGTNPTSAKQKVEQVVGSENHMTVKYQESEEEASGGSGAALNKPEDRKMVVYENNTAATSAVNRPVIWNGINSALKRHQSKTAAQMRVRSREDREKRAVVCEAGGGAGEEDWDGGAEEDWDGRPDHAEVERGDEDWGETGCWQRETCEEKRGGKGEQTQREGGKERRWASWSHGSSCSRGEEKTDSRVDRSAAVLDTHIFLQGLAMHSEEWSHSSSNIAHTAGENEWICVATKKNRKQKRTAPDLQTHVWRTEDSREHMTGGRWQEAGERITYIGQRGIGAGGKGRSGVTSRDKTDGNSNRSLASDKGRKTGSGWSDGGHRAGDDAGDGAWSGGSSRVCSASYDDDDDSDDRRREDVRGMNTWRGSAHQGWVGFSAIQGDEWS